MVFPLSGGGYSYRQATLTKVWVALPCGRNLSLVDIANQCDPKFSDWKKLENQQKHRRPRSVCVEQADFGKLVLNNTKNDSSNSQHLSVKCDQFEINNARDWPIERPQSFQILCLLMTTSLAYVKRPSSRLLMTRPIAYITCFNRQGRRVIIFGAKGVLRFPNVRPSVSKIVFQ